VVKAAMRGILPATIGLSVAMGVQMAQPLFGHARQEGPLRISIYLIILTAAGLLLAVANFSPVSVLVLSGAAGALVLALVPAKPTTSAQEDEP
jgi:chromate transport protein ChrA